VAGGRGAEGISGFEMIGDRVGFASFWVAQIIVLTGIFICVNYKSDDRILAYPLPEKIYGNQN